MRELNLPPGSIVVGVDGSDHAQRAVDLAATEAQLQRRPLAAVYARPPVDRRITSWAVYGGAMPSLPEGEGHVRSMLTDAVAAVTEQYPGSRSPATPWKTVVLSVKPGWPTTVAGESLAGNSLRVHPRGREGFSVSS